jgi:hypothetical protein
MDAQAPVTVPLEVIEAIAKLTPDAIRARLAELDGERRCLLSLLRSRLALDRAVGRALDRTSERVGRLAGPAAVPATADLSGGE